MKTTLKNRFDPLIAGLRQRRLLAWLLLAVPLAGCLSTMGTRQLGPEDLVGNRGVERNRNGVGYNLPSGRIKITAVKQPGQTPTFTVETQYVSDPDYALTLSAKASGMADEDVSIDKEPGTELLKKITANYTDKTGEVVETLVKTGVKAFQLTHGIIPPQKERAMLGQTERVAERFYSFTWEFDPFDERQLAAAKVLFRKHELTLDFRGRLSRRMQNYSEVPSDTKRVYYRTLLPYQLVIQDPLSNSYHAATVMLPDESPILSLDVRRALFVAKVNEVTFDHGMLTAVHTIKPSEVLAMTKTLGNIVDEIAALSPIQIKIDQSSARSALLQQQTAEITQRGAQLDAMLGALNSQQTFTAREAEIRRQAEEAKAQAERSKRSEQDERTKREDASRMLKESVEREKATREALEEYKKTHP